MSFRNRLRIDLFALFAFNTMVGPIYVVYLLESGYTVTQVAVLHMLKDVVLLALQVPSGLFADFFRYKHSLVVATVLYVMAMASFLVVANPILVGVGFAAWGAALAFLNGADEGYMYRVSASREVYLETTVRYSIVIRIGWLVTWAIGSLIYAVSAMACFVLSSMVSLVGLGTAIVLPTENSAPDDRSVPASKISITAADVFYLLPYALFSCAIQIIMIYQQVKLTQDGLPVGIMGPVFTLFLLGGMLGSYVFKRLRWTSYRGVLMISNIALPATLILLGFHVSAVLLAVAMIVQSFVYSLMRVANSFEINQAHQGQGVASLFSVQTFMASLFKIPLLGLFGLVADHISLEYAFQLLILPCLCSIGLLFFIRAKPRRPFAGRVVGQ